MKKDHFHFVNSVICVIEYVYIYVFIINNSNYGNNTHSENTDMFSVIVNNIPKAELNEDSKSDLSR